MDAWVIDWETLSNCSVLVAEHYKKEETKVFVIHELQNDFEELMKFLFNSAKNKEKHITFNGLNFDAQINEWLIQHKDFKPFLKAKSVNPDQIAKLIYARAQEIIRKSSAGEFLDYQEYKMLIPQIDIFRTNHWDNANKRSSLKWIQFSMDWPNVQEMPIHHTYEVKTINEINTIVSYCKNDVKSTKNIYKLSKSLLEVRLHLQKDYDLNCLSYSNTKTGSELLLKLYCNNTNQDPRQVRSRGTKREKIVVNDIIFPYVKFQTPELQKFFEKLKSTVIKNTKGDFKYTLPYKGYEFEYGTGGIHQCIKPGVYKVTDNLIIKDADVSSMYPSIAVQNHMYPAHLGKDFYKVYKENIVDVRLAEKKKKENKNMGIIEGFKEAANATYGNSNSEYSWLYDPQYTMQTTINGQLSLTMFVEEILLKIPGAVLLQTNTDGMTFMFSKQYLPIYEQCAKEWEETTKLSLEYADYEAMYIRDVNNYFAKYTNGKTKCKGAYEWEDLANHKVSVLHKNKSHLIIPKAIYNYFINNIPPEKYLQENRNIYDYCGGVKSKGDWYFSELKIEDGIYKEKKLQKVMRYYISKNGSKIVKRHPDGRQLQIEAGEWMMTEFNTYQEKPWVEYGVNDKYYLKKIYEEISNIVSPPTNQLSLF